jgi:hypothetical protein
MQKRRSNTNAQTHSVSHGNSFATLSSAPLDGIDIDGPALPNKIGGTVTGHPSKVSGSQPTIDGLVVF